MKAENEKALIDLISELRAEVERLKSVQPVVIHYHYPPAYYWPPPPPWWLASPVAPTTWWYIPNTTAANSNFSFTIDSTSGANTSTVTNRLTPFTYTNTTGGQY